MFVTLGEVTMDDIFYPKKNNEDSMIVKVLWTDMIDDVAVVSYKDKEYTLYWNDSCSYYAGEVNGLEGYLV